MPPKTPVLTVGIPSMVKGGVFPLRSMIPRSTPMTPIVAIITRKPTVAARADTPSFLAMPSATPMAKISGSAPKIGSPEARMISRVIRTNDGRSQLFCWAPFRTAPPTPSRMPATGSTATGSISDLPSFCMKPNTLLPMLSRCGASGLVGSWAVTVAIKVSFRARSNGERFRWRAVQVCERFRCRRRPAPGHGPRQRSSGRGPGRPGPGRWPGRADGSAP